MPHRLVIFDWNGTILADTLASWRAANICLEFYGVRPITLKRYLDTTSFPIIHFYVRNGVSVDKVLATKTKGHHLFQNAYEDLAKNARTRYGVREVLLWLHGQNVACIVLSNYVTHRIQSHVRRLNLGVFFQAVCAHEDDGGTIVEYTSKMERLSAYMVKRNYSPAHAVIIGDSVEEPAVARALGLTSIGVRGGSFSDMQLRHARPDYTIGNVLAAKKILEDLWR